MAAAMAVVGVAFKAPPAFGLPLAPFGGDVDLWGVNTFLPEGKSRVLKICYEERIIIQRSMQGRHMGR